MKNHVMLASNESWIPEDLKQGTIYLISNKFDGVLAYNDCGRLCSRKNYNIPNKYVQEKFRSHLLNNCVGELILPGQDFHTTSGVIRSFDDPRGEDVLWMLFDYKAHPEEPYATRHTNLAHLHSQIKIKDTRIAQQEIFAKPGSLESLAEELSIYAIPFEGYIVRDLNAPYKFGRATKKEASLFKLVASTTSTAILAGVEARYDKNEMKALPEVGSIILSNKEATFSCGTGWSRTQGRAWWKDKASLIGKIITFSYKSCGVRDGVPRQPVYISGL